MSIFSDTLKTVGKKTGITDIYEGTKTGNIGQIEYGINKLSRGPTPYYEDAIADKFSKFNTTFSGTDCACIAQLNDKIVMLPNVSSISYSIFREKGPVRVLGRSGVKGYCGGTRTISGSIVFIVFNQAPLYDLLKEFVAPKNPQDRYTSPVPDQLPPIDLVIWGGNEYGHKSLMRLFGVEFVQEGQVQSVNDIYTENVTQYVARDIDELLPYDDLDEFKNSMFKRMMSGAFVDNYLGSMMDYKSDVERKLQEIDNTIYKINQEKGRKNIATLGMMGLFGNRNLNDALKQQIDYKASYLKELDGINNQILKYEQNVYGFNAQRGDSVAGKDNMKASTPSRGY